MSKIISREYLDRNLTGQKLKKVGEVKIGSDKLSGVKLKRAIKGYGGKTDTKIEELLRKGGVDYQKRGRLMDLIRGEKKSGLSEEQIERNLEIRKQRDLPGLARIKSNRPKGTMTDIGISRGNVGFSQNFNNKKPPVGQPPKAPLGGVRPIGL